MDDSSGEGTGAGVTDEFVLLRIPYELDKAKDVQAISVSGEQDAASVAKNDNVAGYYYVLVKGAVVPLEQWAPRECKHTYHKPVDIY